MSISDQRVWFEDRFQSELSWRDGTVEGTPSWFSQLITDLILATGDEAIRYFSAKYVPPGRALPGSVSVVAFTDKIVAYANFDAESSASATSLAPLEVLVTARRMLSSFSLESVPSDLDAGRDSIGDVRITVNYPQFSRTLPLGESDWRERDTETADLITCLRRDVVSS